MLLEQMKSITFPKPTLSQWKEAAKKASKQNSLNHLYKETYEEITLSPLYTKEPTNKDRIGQYPGGGSSVRGFHSPEKGNSWLIAQRIRHRGWNELKEQVRLSLERGQEVISFDPDYLEKAENINFRELNNQGQLQQVPLFILTNQHFEMIVSKLHAVKTVQLKGAVAQDLLTAWIARGLTVNPESEFMDSRVARWVELHHCFPKLRTILIDSKPFKEAGAHVVQELGISLASAVFYIEHLKNAGWPPEAAAGKMIFRFAIGNNFFMELSKFRAFRVLWKTVADAYEIPADQQAVPVLGETSEWTKSFLDPHVNILRAGNEAFAAVLGGVDYLHVTPFDEYTGGPTDVSARIARNTQLLLKEESRLEQVIDPAGGSYYIEHLTSRIVKESWDLFQKIDRNGGILETLKKGWIQKIIKETAAAAMEDFETLQRSAVGVNKYAIADETISLPRQQKLPVPDIAAKGTVQIEALSPHRLAEKFEGLRKRSDLLAKKGSRPSVRLVCVGDLNGYKPLADFVTGVLAAGGIESVWSKELKSPEEAKEYIKQADSKYFCVCGSESSVKELGPQIVRWAKEHIPDIHLEMAGKLPEGEFESLDLDGVYISGQNIYQKLHALLDRWEEDEHETKA
ncbi:methylmalonyl-CoA mutase family protein [Siminovitchia sediminis]|uniref:Methylmalonyl-CoA mutase family protein n=1 Tax=Siminovitchia sediminis TaxID=1274353 RepID=A0ABW4KJU3_9BACI